MTSRTTRRFRSAFEQLPLQIQRQARTAYKRFVQDPEHPGLQFKKVHATLPIYSVRITKDYRTVGIREGNKMLWFWIGSHSDYNQIMRQL